MRKLETNLAAYLRIDLQIAATLERQSAIATVITTSVAPALKAENPKLNLARWFAACGLTELGELPPPDGERDELEYTAEGRVLGFAPRKIAARA